MGRLGNRQYGRAKEHSNSSCVWCGVNTTPVVNSGTFKKGEKKRRQGERGPGKTTLAAREAIAKLVDGNVDRVQGWLDQIASEDGPKAAMTCCMDLLEYHVPKLARTEVAGSADGTPIIVEIRRD